MARSSPATNDGMRRAEKRAHSATLQGILPCVTDYRRDRVPGGTFFFTVNLPDRRSELVVTQIQALRDAVRQVRLHTPFHIDARVVPPYHMLCRWTLRRLRRRRSPCFAGDSNEIHVTASDLCGCDGSRRDCGSGAGGWLFKRCRHRWRCRALCRPSWRSRGRRRLRHRSP